MKDTLNAVNQRETRSNVKGLQGAKKQLEEAYIKEQESYARGKINKIESAAEHQKFKLVWGTLNEFTGRKSANVGKITAKSPQDHVQKWRDHFINLLGQPPVITSKPTTNFSLEELRKCIKGFRNNKSSGLDNIPIEARKTDAMSTQLLEVCNRTLNGTGLVFG